jgi:hypothetical protein
MFLLHIEFIIDHALGSLAPYGVSDLPWKSLQ